MSGSWDIVFHEQPARQFFSCRGPQRVQLQRTLDDLASNPERPFDYEIKDATGRANRVIRCQQWAIVYWLDSFVSELGFVSLEKISL